MTVIAPTKAGPIAAPVGTEVVMLVAVLATTTADAPLILTALLAGVISKFVPAMVTVVPAPPLVGLKLVMVGTTTTVNAVELVAV